jgi:hypothetical protein
MKLYTGHCIACTVSCFYNTASTGIVDGEKKGECVRANVTIEADNIAKNTYLVLS